MTIDSHPPDVDAPDPDTSDLDAPAYPTHDRDVSPLVRRFTGSEAGRDTRSNPVLLVGLIALIVFGFEAGGWQVMLVVGALVLSVTLHEAGHFLAAKQAGMKVTEFFVGFGPRIFSFRKGETEYGLKLVPIAAYVRPIGANNLEEVDPEDEPRTVRSKTFWRRFSIFFAGPAMNLLIAGACIWALIAFSGVPKSGLFQAQAEPSNWKVAQVVAGSAAANAGIQTDDRIVAFDGQQIGKFSDLHTVMVVERNGKTVTLTTVDPRRGVAESTARRPRSAPRTAIPPPTPASSHQRAGRGHRQGSVPARRSYRTRSTPPMPAKTARRASAPAPSRRSRPWSAAKFSDPPASPIFSGSGSHYVAATRARPPRRVSEQRDSQAHRRRRHPVDDRPTSRRSTA